MPKNNEDYVGYKFPLFGEAGCRKNEADFVLSLLPQNGSLLEIGTYHGFTISYMAAERPDVKFVSVDPFPQKRLDDKTDKYPIGNTKLWEQNKRQNNELFIGDIVGYIDYIVKCSSVDGMRQFDVIFIDGNHYYDYVIIDLENSIPLVKNGGVIAVHDYGKDSHRDVKIAVDEFVNKTAWFITEIKESVVILRRK